MSFGNASTSSGTVPFWPTATITNPTIPTTGFYPTADTQLPNSNATLGTGLVTYSLHLVSDATGHTLADSAAGHSSPAPVLASTTMSQLLTTGPY